MKLLIAGSRSFTDYDLLKFTVDEYLSRIKEIVSGGAEGADMLGEQYAWDNNIPVKQFRPDYVKYYDKKRYAPLARNIDMAEYCDMAIIFWDGKSGGTEHMIEWLGKYNKDTRLTLFDNKK